MTFDASFQQKPLSLHIGTFSLHDFVLLLKYYGIFQNTTSKISEIHILGYKNH